jgi:phosphate transport system ATP-binding protein
MAEPVAAEPDVAPAAGKPRLRIRVETEKLTAMYGKFTAVKGVSLAFPANRVHALIGPSGCGKSTFLRTLNRMHEITEGGWITGRVLLDGEDIYAPRVNAMQLRRRVGMVFQRPTPFPTMSVYDNVAKLRSTAGSRGELTVVARSGRHSVG